MRTIVQGLEARSTGQYWHTGKCWPSALASDEESFESTEVLRIQAYAFELFNQEKAKYILKCALSHPLNTAPLLPGIAPSR